MGMIRHLLCHRFKFWAIFCFCLWSIAACSSAVQIEYFRIDAAAPSSSTTAIDEVIAVENFRSAPFLRRQEIIVCEQSHLAISSLQLWWALPEEMVTEALIDYLVSQKAFRHVLPYPTVQPVEYILEGSLKQFEIHDSGEKWEVKLAMHVLLLERTANKIAWDSGIVATTLPCEPNFSAAAVAMGNAAHQLFAQLLAKLQEVLANRQREK
jgi:ABC-type uncharacterized transport system auxiliary subunit